MFPSLSLQSQVISEGCVMGILQNSALVYPGIAQRPLAEALNRLHRNPICDKQATNKRAPGPKMP